jgi:GTP-binding protein
VIVSEIAGTTRDSVDVRLEHNGRSLVVIDTAGVRKKKSWADDVERYSHQRATDAIRRADVAVLLLEATEPTSQIEKALVKELIDRCTPTIVALNKWDLVEDTLSIEDYLKHFDQELPSLSFAPIVTISGKTGEGLEELMALAFNLFEQAGHRETTGRLNAAFERILSERGPSSRLGTQAKVYYVSQIGTHPPTIAAVVNKPDLFEGQYERYLKNRLRDLVPQAGPLRRAVRAIPQEPPAGPRAVLGGADPSAVHRPPPGRPARRSRCRDPASPPVLSDRDAVRSEIRGPLVGRGRVPPPVARYDHENASRV